MLIRVIRNDSRYDMVKEQQLENLIERGEVVKFQRSSGWVTIGIDPIRKARQAVRLDKDRRRQPERGSA